MKVNNFISRSAAVLVTILLCQFSFAQVDRHDVRSGNRKFRKGDYSGADISYRKALVKDSTSFAANYNLASNLYRQGNMDEAATHLESLSQVAPVSPYGADYYYNKGDVAIAKEDWQGAVNAFKQSLLRNPADMDAKENYIYAKKKLQEQQQGGGGGGDNNEDRNQDQQNQDQQGGGNDKEDQNQQNQDQNQDQNQQNQDNQSGEGQQPREGKISPQQAQQMLQAIQAKEKETQDKVNKEKAEALKSRQKEKNW